MTLQMRRPRAPAPHAARTRAVQGAARKAPSPPAGGAVKGADRGYAVLLTLAVWALLVILLLRWDWLDPTQSGVPFNDSTTKVVCMLIGAVIAFRFSAKSFRVTKFVNRGFLAFLVVVPLSILWSISPLDTVYRYVTIGSIVLVSWAFSSVGWHPRRYQDVLRPFFTAVLIASVIIGINQPTWIIEGGDLKDAWHGLVNSKNAFGQVAGFGVLFWAHAWLYDYAKWWRAAPFLALSVVCLFLSHSSTSLLSTMFAAFLLVLLCGLPPYMRRYMPYIVGLFAVCVLIYLGAVLQLIPGLDILFAPIHAITGKDATFTDRSRIWQIIGEHRALNPFMGTGYGAYWIGPEPSSPSYTFVGRMFFYPWESHNGYLEMANDLGYLGVVMLFGFLIDYIRQCIALFKTERPQAVLFTAIFFHQAMTNFSESEWLVVTAPIGFVVTTLAVFSLARLLADHSPRGAKAAAGVQIRPRIRMPALNRRARS
jgi:exopolysaccharide production protein ExoQ